MGVFQGDIRIKAAIEQGLEDLKKNPWLIEDILSDTVANPYLKKRFSTQILDCQKWLASNAINIYMSEREDKTEYPAITIALGDSEEKTDMKTMGDISTERAQFTPNYINRPMPYVIQPGAGAYDSTTGLFNFSSTVNLTLIAPGMLVVNPANGIAYKVVSVDGNGISLGLGLTVPSGTYGILPQFQIYEALVGHTFMDESYEIDCHTLDQQTNLWLNSIVMYFLFRYRQVLLEANGFSQVKQKNGKLRRNESTGSEGQFIWSRKITISGQVENTWIMAPHRFIETVNFKDPTQEEGYYGGIKIVSNLNDTEDLSQVNWQTVADESPPDFMSGNFPDDL
jgi:hypothetical protein